VERRGRVPSATAALLAATGAGEDRIVVPIARRVLSARSTERFVRNGFMMTSAKSKEPVGVYETVSVHFEDLDAYGMVHHNKYPFLFERAFNSYLIRKGFPFGRGSGSPVEMVQVVRSMQLTYDVPITRLGEVQVQFWLEHVGRTSFTYEFVILSADRATVHASGTRAMVNLDVGTLRPAPLTWDLLDFSRPLMSDELLATLEARESQSASPDGEGSPVQ
jgi:acyl-CoA thioester hydrolase